MPSNYNGRGGPKKSDGKIAEKVSEKLQHFFLRSWQVGPGVESGIW